MAARKIKPAKAWVAVSPDRHININTASYTRKECIAKHVESFSTLPNTPPYKWRQLYRWGHRIVPVTLFPNELKRKKAPRGKHKQLGLFSGL